MIFAARRLALETDIGAAGGVTTEWNFDDALGQLEGGGRRRDSGRLRSRRGGKAARENGKRYSGRSLSNSGAREYPAQSPLPQLQIPMASLS